jgi:hypothetical protein
MTPFNLASNERENFANQRSAKDGEILAEIMRSIELIEVNSLKLFGQLHKDMANSASGEICRYLALLPPAVMWNQQEISTRLTLAGNQILRRR